MGFLLKTSTWMLTLALLVGIVDAALSPGLDTSDDFSFSVPRHAWSRCLLRADQIERVLKGRLQGVEAGSVSRLAAHLLKLCREHRFDPAFVLSVIEAESRFHAQARSPAGATGLMQLMPGTARWLKSVSQDPEWPSEDGASGIVITQLLLDPYENLSLGVSYLAYLRDRYRSSSPMFLLTAYRMGPARMDAFLKQMGEGKGGRWIPHQEQLEYYQRIRKWTRRFRSIGRGGDSHV
jgi:hypothetical protein